MYETKNWSIFVTKGEDFFAKWEVLRAGACFEPTGHGRPENWTVCMYGQFHYTTKQ